MALFCTLALLALILLTTTPKLGADDAARLLAEVEQGPLDVLVIGDSLAESLSPQFTEEAWKRGLRAQVLGGPACGALESSTLRDASGFLRNFDASCVPLRRRWEDRIKMASSGWVLLVEGWPGERDKPVGESWAHPCSANFDRTHARDLRRLVDRIHAAGAKAALLLAPPPDAGELSKAFLAKAGAESREQIDPVLRQRIACLNRVRIEVAETSGAEVLDLESELCPGGACKSQIWEFDLRPDGVHFQGLSATWASGWILDQLSERAAR